MNSISIYTAHDASICINPEKNLYRIYEFERIIGNRYCSIHDISNEYFIEYCTKVFNLIKNEYGIEQFDTCYLGCYNFYDTYKHTKLLDNIFNVTNFIPIGHHDSHAASTFYQSGFTESLVISFDGGGFDNYTVSTFNIYHCTIGRIIKLATIPLDLGNPYSFIAKPISEIRKGNLLSYAGKIMGLAGYGKVINKWIEPIEQFYTLGSWDGYSLRTLGEKLKLDMSHDNTLSEKASYDLAATSQYVFEEIAMKTIMPYIREYNIPICLTGGCALNVLFNEKLRNTISLPIYISPNPNDCGISLGQLLMIEPPDNTNIDITYNGVGLLDINELDSYIEKYNAVQVTPEEIAKLLADGNIIGIAKENSECGPRALGNRSILCDPSVDGMKDILNAKVKFREWYRPFAPIVKVEDVNKYFDFEGVSNYMSFAPKVNPEWRKELQSVTHVDNTSRIQTLSREQNPIIYDILTEFEKIKGFGVILNTSFNIKGKPILTTIKDAIEVLEQTEIDYVIIENWLFKKL